MDSQASSTQVLWMWALLVRLVTRCRCEPWLVIPLSVSIVGCVTGFLGGWWILWHFFCGVPSLFAWSLRITPLHLIPSWNPLFPRWGCRFSIRQAGSIPRPLLFSSTMSDPELGSADRVDAPISVHKTLKIEDSAVDVFFLFLMQKPP